MAYLTLNNALSFENVHDLFLPFGINSVAVRDLIPNVESASDLR